MSRLRWLTILKARKDALPEEQEVLPVEEVKKTVKKRTTRKKVVKKKTVKKEAKPKKKGLVGLLKKTRIRRKKKED